MVSIEFNVFIIIWLLETECEAMIVWILQLYEKEYEYNQTQEYVNIFLNLVIILHRTFNKIVNKPPTSVISESNSTTLLAATTRKRKLVDDNSFFASLTDDNTDSIINFIYILLT